MAWEGFTVVGAWGTLFSGPRTVEQQNIGLNLCAIPCSVCDLGQVIYPAQPVSSYGKWDKIVLILG